MKPSSVSILNQNRFIGDRIFICSWIGPISRQIGVAFCHKIGTDFRCRQIQMNFFRAGVIGLPKILDSIRISKIQNYFCIWHQIFSEVSKYLVIIFESSHIVNNQRAWPARVRNFFTELFLDIDLFVIHHLFFENCYKLILILYGLTNS